MTTAADNLVPLTGNPLIDGLTWGAAWQFGGGAHTLTYSLSLNDNPSGGAWTTALSNAARQALANWSNVANITFVESGSGTVYSQSSADIALILTGNDLQSSAPGVVGLGIPPSPSYADTLLPGIGETRTSYPRPEGDVALDNYYSGFNYLDAGGIGLTIMLHEIGHALGLKHTTDGGGSGRPTFASLGISGLDSNLYTVMSYTDALGQPLGSNQSSGNAATPMPLDILAMQQIYGANTNYHTGDDTYTINPSGTSPSASTIWDAGGNDTLAVRAGSVGAAMIDLREGHYSYIGGYQVAVAYNATIENAVGANYADTLIGNAAANRLDGGGGYDVMMGVAGDDTYIVDSTSDVVTEQTGEGTDTIVFTMSFSGLTLPLNVENLTLAGFANLSGVGNALDNILTGNSASNLLTGAEGNDTLIGGSGDDTLLGESTATNLSPPDGGVITGIGYGISDLLQGGNGNDTLDGGIGDDTMQGGAADDTYIVTSAGDVVTELANQGNDTVFSLVSYALPANVENLTLAGSDYVSATGNELDNRLIGNSGRNALYGGAGADTIDGGFDNDQITGGAGADNLEGGEGDDLFLIGSVADFAVGEVIDGGNGSNEIRYTGTTAATFALTPLVSNISWVRISSVDGDWSGDAAIDVDASATTASYLVIAGNSGNNRLIGNAGDNSLYAGFGDDTLIGGGGDDLLGGNGGNDVVLIGAGADHGSNEYIDGGDGSNLIRFTSTLGGDTLTLSTHITNIQSIAISDASGATNGTLALNVNAGAMSTGVTLIGNAGANSLSGGGGNDTLDGGLGADWLQGDAGTDTLILTPDSVWSSAHVGFNEGSPTLAGTGQKVSLAGKNRFSDVLDGGTDTDTLQLTDGNDAYFLHDAFSGFTAGVTLATDVRGQASAVRGLSIEQILAGGGDDLIDLTSANYSIGGVSVDGGSGNDMLWGNAGNDTLLGGDGNDTLFGGAGNDFLSGGAGADVFQFVHSGGGNDQISDFDTAQDKLRLYGATSLSDLTSQVIGSDLLLTWNGQSITLQGVTDAPSSGWIVLG